MSELTDSIERTRRTWAEHDDSEAQLAERRARAAAAGAVRSLTEVLSEDRLALIVEPKRATPQRGTINPELDVAAVVAECEAGGACAISIVTEPLLSAGRVEDLTAARGACELPLIARDFVVDVRQVYELRAAGADALHVPVSAHLDDDDHELDVIILAAHQLGMEVVLSVHNDDELEFAIGTDADVLNIDNRVGDGRIDVERTFELLADVPVGWPVISESIAAVDHVAKLHRAGVDALLLDEGHLDTGLTSALAVYADLSLDA
ncbi:MAG: Indole-3-glycerol-phosphate synthase [Thermoleophilia bacterium]|nr:Indole-3-glycerol-phosphate synthase [Thermoleophilia bacterium]